LLISAIFLESGVTQFLNCRSVRLLALYNKEFDKFRAEVQKTINQTSALDTCVYKIQGILFSSWLRKFVARFRKKSAQFGVFLATICGSDRMIPVEMNIW